LLERRFIRNARFAGSTEEGCAYVLFVRVTRRKNRLILRHSSKVYVMAYVPIPIRHFGNFGTLRLSTAFVGAAKFGAKSGSGHVSLHLVDGHGTARQSVMCQFL
jgi:hypothetical protein